MPSMRFSKAIVAGISLLLASMLLAACGGDGSGGDAERAPGASLPQGSEPVDLNPVDFTVEIDNPYWPMVPGSRWLYRESDGEGGVQRVVVTVTDRTKRIANGIEARVVHDVVSQGGEPVEVTDDWYAQDVDGNVWYLGERTAEYEEGKLVSRAGSWEAGVDGAQPGIAMPADPEVGMAYRQEYYAGEAEDRAKVLSVDEQVEVPFGHYTDAVLTKDLVPTDPRVLEYKLYVPGVGPVMTLDVSGASGREELDSFAAPARR
jgi:predicted small secreted protein